MKRLQFDISPELDKRIDRLMKLLPYTAVRMSYLGYLIELGVQTQERLNTSDVFCYDLEKLNKQLSETDIDEYSLNKIISDSGFTLNNRDPDGCLILAHKCTDRIAKLDCEWTEAREIVNVL